jgi:putative salt-induced outer membrane protein YdiY
VAARLHRPDARAELIGPPVFGDRAQSELPARLFPATPDPSRRDGHMPGGLRRCPLVVWLTAVAPGTAFAQPQAPVDAIDAIVRTHEARLIAAIANKDGDALEGLVAPEFVLRQDPPVGRAAWIEEVLRLCGGGRAEIHDLQVERVTGAGVVSVVATIHRDPACQPPSTRVVVTDVWLERDGSWLLSLRHVTPTAVGGAGPADPMPDARAPEWAGTAELSLLLTAGNVETQSAGVAAEVQFQRGPWRSFARSSYLRTTTQGQLRARGFNAEVRQSRAVMPWLDVFGRVLYQRELSAGMLHRYGGDAGLGLRVAYRSHSLETTLGAGSTREIRLTGADGTFPVANLGIRYRWAATSTLTFADDLAQSTSLRDVENWRLENVASVVATLRHPFSVKLSFTTRYLRQPVPGFERTDTIMSAALVARF